MLLAKKINSGRPATLAFPGLLRLTIIYTKLFFEISFLFSSNERLSFT